MADNGTSRPTRDVDDISLDDVRPARKGGSGGWIIVLILLIAIVAVGWYILNERKEAAERAREAAAIADANRQANVARVTQTLQEAVNDYAAGSVGAAVEKLRTAESQLGLIISTANSEGNTDAATELVTKRASVSAAVSAVSAALDENLPIVSQQFGLQPAAPPAPEATAPEAGTAPAPTIPGEPTPPPAAPVPPASMPGATTPAPPPVAPVPPGS